MSSAPQVTVIIPTRDALTWLPSAVASIGPDPRVEIVIVDDGSVDGTLNWLGEQAAADRRLRFLRSTRVGPSRARNLAISAARAPLIAFLDADDRWLPGKLDAQLALHAAHPEIGFSFTDYRHVTTDGGDRGGCFDYWPHFATRYGKAREPFILDRPVATLYGENVVGTSTVLARTDLLRQVGGFGTDLLSAEDWDLWLRLASRAPVGVVPAILMDYLMHRPGNLTAKVNQRIVAMHFISEQHRSAALAQDPNALRVFNQRFLGARAEAASAGGHHLTAAGLRLRAFLGRPSRRELAELRATVWPAASR